MSRSAWLSRLSISVSCVCALAALNAWHPPSAAAAWNGHAGSRGSSRKAAGPQGVEQIAQLVERHVAALPGYQRGFLISRGDVMPIFDALKRAGWDSEELDLAYADLLDDGDFLVQQLRTNEGRKFMEKAGRLPTLYDRMDRVAGEKGGSRAVRYTIELPDGPSFWNPHAKPGFANMVQMLPTRNGTRRSADEFDEPTGKIYTAPQLVQRLSQLYAKQKQAQQQRKPSSEPQGRP